MIAAVKENNYYGTSKPSFRMKRFSHNKKTGGRKPAGRSVWIESRLHTANGRIHEWHLYKKYGGGMMYDWGVH